MEPTSDSETVWRCPECDRMVSEVVNGYRCPFCRAREVDLDR